MKRVQKEFKKSSKRVQKEFKKSSKRVQNEFKKSSKRVQKEFKKSSKRVQKESLEVKGSRKEVVKSAGVTSRHRFLSTTTVDVDGRAKLNADLG